MALTLTKRRQTTTVMPKRLRDRRRIAVESGEAFTREVIRPQPGPQERFLACPADIVFYGGAAGGGKTAAMVMDMGATCSRTPRCHGVIFRRLTPMITNPGGLLEETNRIFPSLGGRLNQSTLTWRFDNGSTVKLGQLQYDNSVVDWQSSQMAVIDFDELTQFSQAQFFYMLSRLRSTCGIRPYVRCGFNPDPTSWVKPFIAWWIDERSGFPIPERSGVVRWFARAQDGTVVWGDTEQAVKDLGHKNPMSFTFIAAKLDDNKILMEKDPSYVSKLDALNPYDRALLRDGNWNVARSNGMLFTVHKIKVLDEVPVDVARWIRYWDRAATEPSTENPDPDWTAGVKIGRRSNGRWVVADCRRARLRPEGVEELIKQTADVDGRSCEIGIEQDPGSAGVSEALYLTRALSGYAVHTRNVSKAKFVRAKPLAAQVEAGNVDVVRGPWNAAFLQELDLFVDEAQMKPPPGYHDDQVDGASGGFNLLSEHTMPLFGRA